MAAGVTLGGNLSKFVARLERLASPAGVVPLLERLEDCITEANRHNILGGVSGADGSPFPKTTYRGGFAIHARTRRANFGDTLHPHQPHGPWSQGLHGNLTRAEYRQLAGPPLAPRGERSRIITNLHTGHRPDGADRYVVEGAWLDVVSAKGVPFLLRHFEGAGGMPRRDARGIGPYGRRLVQRAIREWIAANR